jgi:hypothetical protein
MEPSGAGDGVVACTDVCRQNGEVLRRPSEDEECYRGGGAYGTWRYEGTNPRNDAEVYRCES